MLQQIMKVVKEYLNNCHTNTVSDIKISFVKNKLKYHKISKDKIDDVTAILQDYIGKSPDFVKIEEEIKKIL